MRNVADEQRLEMLKNKAEYERQIAEFRLPAPDLVLTTEDVIFLRIARISLEEVSQ